jgi:4-hydroxy-L-threonine phosphate dehydrogenase PdxA
MKPTIALAMDDPAGISPELTARLLALDEVAAKARLVGREEIDIIAPAVEQARSEGVAAEGPFPADVDMAQTKRA